MSMRCPADAELIPLGFADLAGWALDDHAAAFVCFRRSATRLAVERPVGLPGHADGGLFRIAMAALDLPADVSAAGARAFFETHLQPWLIRPHDGSAFLTGYFEPEVEGSRQPNSRFRYPLYRRPADLVDITEANCPSGWDPTYAFARHTEHGIVRYFDRGEIEDGALAGRGLEIVYLVDPVDAFIIHVQGSAGIRLPDGTRMRVAYAAKAGHPYTSIGKRLIARGIVPEDEMTLARLAALLRENEVEAAKLMRENRSYVFFAELPSADLDPDLGALSGSGVQITPGRSLAVDCGYHSYGTPIWLQAKLPIGHDGDSMDFNRLMIAQDTGSAIVGPARGDIFIGLGQVAGEIAGRIRHVPDAFVTLQPIEGA